MKQVIFCLTCLAIFSVALSQKPNNTVPKINPVADLSIASIKLENAAITKPPTILNNPNGTQQQSTSNTTPANPPIKCTVVIKDEYNKATGVYIKAYIPRDSQVLTSPANTEIKSLEAGDRYNNVAIIYLRAPIGNMEAGTTASIEFTFSRSLKYNNTIIARVDSNIMEDNTANNTNKAGIN